jgi:hypothetical protein
MVVVMHSYISNSITLINSHTGEVRASISSNKPTIKLNKLPNLVLTGSNSSSAEIYLQTRRSNELII